MKKTFQNTGRIVGVEGHSAQFTRNRPEDIQIISSELEEENSAVYEVTSGDVTMTLLDLSSERARELIPSMKSTWLYEPRAIGLTEDVGLRSAGYLGGVYEEGLDLRSSRKLYLGDPVAVEIARTNLLGRNLINQIDRIRSASKKTKLLDQVVRWNYLTPGTSEREIFEMIDCVRGHRASIVLDIRKTGSELGEEQEWEEDPLGDVLNCFDQIAEERGEDHLVFYGIAESELENSPLRNLDPEKKERTHVVSRQGFFIFKLNFSEDFPRKQVFPTKYLKCFADLNGLLAPDVKEVFTKVDQIGRAHEPLRIPSMENLGEEVNFSEISMEDRDQAFIEEFVSVYKSTFKKQKEYEKNLSIHPQSFEESKLRELLEDNTVKVYVARNEESEIIGFFLGTKEIEHASEREYHVFDPEMEIEGERLGDSRDTLLTLSLGVHPEHRKVFGNVGFLTLLRYVMAHTESNKFGGDVAFTWRNDFLMNLAPTMGSGKQWVDVYNYIVTHVKPK